MERKRAKRQPICMAKPAYNFFNHTFTSFSSTGQKVLQTCPSLTKLLPKSKQCIAMIGPRSDKKEGQGTCPNVSNQHHHHRPTHTPLKICTIQICHTKNSKNPPNLYIGQNKSSIQDKYHSLFPFFFQLPFILNR